MNILRFCAALLFACALAAPAVAQHCGGPCEVRRPAAPAVSPNPRFGLVAGPEKANWRYLDNFIWTVDGRQTHRLEQTLSAPRMAAFGHRRIFLSPAGNGLLVTGNPYVETHSRHPGVETPLFVFCSPEGRILAEVTLAEAFAEAERVPGPCPGCPCEDVLYVFGRDPALSANDCFVELGAPKSERVVTFCLPIGAPVADRPALEERLAALDWARVPDGVRERRRTEIKAFVAALDGADADARATAEQGLIDAGYLALPILRSQAKEGTHPIEQRLKPWSDVGYERMSIDLGLLTGLLTYAEEPVTRAVRARLTKILPDDAAADPGAWVSEHRERLEWDDEIGRYTVGSD